MPDESKFAIYLSHSWRPGDVELNRLVWNEVCASCELLVDVPDEAGAEPPYFINRIEELLRRSDLFLGVLTHRVEADRPQGGIDAKLQSSVYAAFEIRLAERFDIPRLILYERKTGFKAPRESGPHRVYIAFDRAPSSELPDMRQWRSTIAPKIQGWLRWMIEHRRPASYEESSLAIGLLPPDAPDADAVAAALEPALRGAGYERIALRAAFRNNVEAFHALHSAGLVVVDVAAGDAVAHDLHVLAHALCVPAIRTLRAAAPADEQQLPWFLRGHPGGYQRDLVTWTSPEHMVQQITPRASAMFRVSRALGDAETRHYLHSKRYSRNFVFISHTLKPPHRGLVEAAYGLLAERYVKPFEYHMANASGQDWKRELDQQLQRTTHFIVLLTDGYEQSPVCTYEIDEILKRGDQVKVLPFMANGRSTPHPKLGHLHHRLLSATSPAANAETLVQQLMEALDDAKADPA